MFKKPEKDYICLAIYCYTSPMSSNCNAIPGGAMEGTTCASGKVNYL